MDDAKTGSLPIEGPFPTELARGAQPKLRVVTNDDEEGDVMPISVVEDDDGGVTIDFGDGKDDDDLEDPLDNDHNENIAEDMEEDELSSIASDLLDGIERDKASRQEWMDTRALGISLLGLTIEKSRADAGGSSAPVEGMSTVRHPLLLNATVSFQATARGELLPASGPVKVRNDSPIAPQALLQTTSAQQQLSDSLSTKDELATALEKDMNHYLTSTATEYVPDTDRMLFYVGFGGDGFKKVYNCPLRRRPVSESVDAEDLIVSNAATDMYNAARITHRIKMKRSTMRRMQISEAYLDIDLALPAIAESNPVDKKKEEISGVKQVFQRPEDKDYEVYECYCELDLDKYAPKQFKGKGLPLPYIVVMEHESRKVLSVRRNWEEEDKECMACRYFVQFPFIRGLGFYGLGFIHLLGNVTNTLTAAWRLILDNGMFANFPGFLYTKTFGRQNSNIFRIGPGTGQPMDIPAGQRIQDAIMNLPYKEVGPSFSTFISHLEDVGAKLGAVADISIGEGKQDAPVGTTLALIEQNTKVLDSAHKRLHAAQAEEFKLLKDCFRRDPEAFWRHNKRPTIQWRKQQFLQALEDNDLVPVADPNNPTSLHRMAKGALIKQLQQASPEIYDKVAVDMRVLRVSNVDPEGLFLAKPVTPPPDPKLLAVLAKAQKDTVDAQLAHLELQLKTAQAAGGHQNEVADRESNERIEQMKIKIEELHLQQEQLIHGQEQQRAQQTHQMEMAQNQQAHEQKLGFQTEQQQHKMQLAQHEAVGGAVKDVASAVLEHHTERAKAGMEQQTARMQSQNDMTMEQEKHQAQMKRDQEKHELEMELMRERHKHELQQAKEMKKATGDSDGGLAKEKVKTEQANRGMSQEKHKASLATQDAQTGMVKAKTKAIRTAKPKPAAKGK